MKHEIELILISLFSRIEMNIPNNFTEILDFCFGDITDSSDIENWSDDDVVIALRRWMESKSE